MKNEELIEMSRRPYLLKVMIEILKKFESMDITIKEAEFILENIKSNLKEIRIKFEHIQER